MNLLSDIIVRSDETQKSVFWTRTSLQWTSFVRKSAITPAVPACSNTMIISEHRTSSVNPHKNIENPVLFPFSGWENKKFQITGSRSSRINWIWYHLNHKLYAFLIPHPISLEITGVYSTHLCAECLTWVIGFGDCPRMEDHSL